MATDEQVPRRTTRSQSAAMGAKKEHLNAKDEKPSKRKMQVVARIENKNDGPENGSVELSAINEFPANPKALFADVLKLQPPLAEGSSVLVHEHEAGNQKTSKPGRKLKHRQILRGSGSDKKL